MSRRRPTWAGICRHRPTSADIGRHWADMGRHRPTWARHGPDLGTDDVVREGKVQSEDKEGNDEADKATKKGIEVHEEGVVKVAGWFTSRHLRYSTLIKDIHTHLIEGSKIGKDLLERKTEETQGIQVSRRKNPKSEQSLGKS